MFGRYDVKNIKKVGRNKHILSIILMFVRLEKEKKDKFTRFEIEQHCKLSLSTLNETLKLMSREKILMRYRINPDNYIEKYEKIRPKQNTSGITIGYSLNYYELALLLLKLNVMRHNFLKSVISPELPNEDGEFLFIKNVAPAIKNFFEILNSMPDKIYNLEVCKKKNILTTCPKRISKNQIKEKNLQDMCYLVLAFLYVYKDKLINNNPEIGINIDKYLTAYFKSLVVDMQLNFEYFFGDYTHFPDLRNNASKDS